MDISILFLSFYVGLLIYLANQNEIERHLSKSPEDHDSLQRTTIVRWMQYGLLAMKFIISLFIVQLAYLSSSPDILKQLDAQVPAIDPNAALLNFVLMLVMIFLAFRVISSDLARQTIRRFAGSESLFDPNSSIHITAVVLVLCFISYIFDQFIGSGGLSGLAQQVSDSGGASIMAFVFQDALMVMGTFLGVGMAIRRDLPQTLERLGLKIPTPQDVIWGVGSGLALIGATLVMVQIWGLLVPADQIAQQSAASDELTKAFNTLPLAFLLSALAAVSEEILFRGALQPVFGLVFVSIVFALSHNQYALTPATLIVFVVGLGLGWLRRRRNTNTAIIAHFIYDFVQLAISILVVQASGGS